MKVVQNRKEWRHDTVMRLIETFKLNAESAIEEAKKIEKYVFQNDLIVEVGEFTETKGLNTVQKEAIEYSISLINTVKKDINSIDQLVQFFTQLISHDVQFEENRTGSSAK